MDEDARCARCRHPRHKHGDEIETFGCYAWKALKPPVVCDCEVFVPFKPTTTDWRLYEMLVGPDKCNWKHGDEPTIEKRITVILGDHKVVIPIPFGTEVSVERRK